MATAIIPKSAVRKEGANNLLHGYAELPSIETEDGTCWVLPGNIIICDPEEANKAASNLDNLIRTNVRKSGRSLLH